MASTMSLNYAFSPGSECKFSTQTLVFQFNLQFARNPLC